MKKYILVLALFFFLPLNHVFAQSGYTLDEVSSHDTTDDCWMIFDKDVYDITDYIVAHDRFMDIRSWCGNDMTEDFQTKAGLGRDHKSSTYVMLEDYKIGEVISVTTTPEQTVKPNTTSSVPDTTSTSDAKSVIPVLNNQNPYNFILPFVLTVVLYLATWLLSKSSLSKQIKLFSKKYFNFFWNTVLLLGLIPSVLVGFYMIFSYSFPSLRDINFNFLYWHVELSIIFGTAGVMHLLTRLTLYLVPIRKFLPKI